MRNERQTITFFAVALAAGMVFCSASFSEARPLVYRFAGMIDSVTFDGQGDPFLGTLQSGMRFRGTVAIDPNASDIFPENPSRGVYELGLTKRGMKARIGRHRFKSDLPADLAEYYTVGMFDNFFGSDELAISTSDGFVKHRGPAVDALLVDHMSIILTDPTETMLDGVSIPFDTLGDFSLLSTNLFAIGGTVGPNNFSISGHLTKMKLTRRRRISTTAIPEPSTLALLVVGVAAVALRRRTANPR